MAVSDYIRDLISDKNREVEDRYRFLGRHKSDLDYYFGNEGRSHHKKHLWAGEFPEHIENMKALYNSFAEDERPEWLTMQDIEDYEKRELEFLNEKTLKESSGMNIKGWTIKNWIDKIPLPFRQYETIEDYLETFGATVKVYSTKKNYPGKSNYTYNARGVLLNLKGPLKGHSINKTDINKDIIEDLKELLSFPKVDFVSDDFKYIDEKVDPWTGESLNERTIGIKVQSTDITRAWKFFDIDIRKEDSERRAIRKELEQELDGLDLSEAVVALEDKLNMMTDNGSLLPDFSEKEYSLIAKVKHYFDDRLNELRENSLNKKTLKEADRYKGEQSDIIDYVSIRYDDDYKELFLIYFVSGGSADYYEVLKIVDGKKVAYNNAYCRSWQNLVDWIERNKGENSAVINATDFGYYVFKGFWKQDTATLIKDFPADFDGSDWTFLDKMDKLEEKKKSLVDSFLKSI